MAHHAVFYQGLYCLLRQKRSSEKEIQLFFEITINDPSVFTIDNSQYIVSIEKKESHKFIRGQVTFLYFSIKGYAVSI